MQLKHLYKVTRIIDRNFEKILTTYLRPARPCQLDTDVERRQYVSGKTASLDSVIRKFGDA
ncbi:MAG: hypothetical protein OXI27_06200 [Thaumarchaeota archaeon]|nr:hypothetical protein [Nitrososphaerota archaeon]